MHTEIVAIVDLFKDMNENNRPWNENNEQLKTNYSNIFLNDSTTRLDKQQEDGGNVQLAFALRIRSSGYETKGSPQEREIVRRTVPAAGGDVNLMIHQRGSPASAR